MRLSMDSTFLKRATSTPDKLLSDHRKLATTVLTAERKLVGDAETFIGSARG